MYDNDDDYARWMTRNALLEGQSKWLAEAETANTLAARAIANVIADVFHQEAEQYKTTTRETTNDTAAFFTNGPTDELPKAG